MTAKHGVVGKGHVVADIAIVPDMGADHKKAAIADARYSAAVFGAGIHGDAFAQLAARADDEPRRAAAIMHRLRRRAERRERINDGAFADRRNAGDMNMGDEADAGFELDLRTDDAIRPDLHALVNARAVGDARGRIDRHLVLGQIAPTSASAISTPPTFASARYHHMLRRCAILST